MQVDYLFVGKTQSPEFYREYFDETSSEENKRQWPEKEYASAYLKESVPTISVSREVGIVGNGIGYPTHIDNAAYRTALVVCSKVYDDFEQILPGSSSHMKPGCFGENILVSDPALHPSEACIGDVYRIGSVMFRVSGPRMPCPKVDAFLGVSGVTAIGRKTSWTGYFFQVMEDGDCSVGDVIELLERPYPGLTMTRIQQSFWGDASQQDQSIEFLELVSTIDCLIPRHYRDTAVQRLARLRGDS